MNEVEEIKNRLDIGEFISSYVPLKPAGRNLRGICPFHSEKTPSFMVSAEKQIWHCFGCHEGGDVFTFYQKIEGVDFPEALEELARRAGVTLTERGPKQDRGEARLFKIQEAAAAFFAKSLQTSGGKAARDYLESRHVHPESITRFRLGVGPSAWEALTLELKRLGYSESEVLASGLGVKGERGLYDRFRARIIFPISDHRGRTVGFAGRILPGDDRSAKYLNSPDSPIYHKGEVIYGLERARDAIRETGEVVLVEGNLDVILSAQSGVLQTVASSGTALTAEQLRRLGRLAGTVKLAFDPDAAGTQALERVASLPRPKDLTLRVIALPPGHDPADIAASDSDRWHALVEGATYLYDYLLELILARHDVSSGLGKRQASSELLPHLSAIPDPIERAHYLKLLAERLGIREDDVRRAAAASPAQKEAEAVLPATGPTEDPLEHHLLGLLLSYPELATQTYATLPPDAFRERDLRLLYTDLASGYNDTASAAPLDLTTLPPELRQVAELLSLSAEYREQDQGLDPAEEIPVATARLMARYFSLLQRRLAEAIKQAEVVGDRERVRELTEKSQRVVEAARERGVIHAGEEA